MEVLRHQDEHGTSRRPLNTILTLPHNALL